MHNVCIYVSFIFCFFAGYFINNFCVRLWNRLFNIESVLLCAGEDGTVRLWEVDSGLCRATWQLKLGPVTCVSWNSSPDPLQQHLLAATAGKALVLIATGTGDVDATQVAESQLEEAEKMATNGHVEVAEEDDAEVDDDDNDNDDNNATKKKRSKKASMVWKMCERDEECSQQVRFGAVVGPRVKLEFDKPVLSIQWHYKGDYLVTLTDGDTKDVVAVHQVCCDPDLI